MPGLPAIPVIRTGPDFPYETLCHETARAHLLIDGATRGVPRTALHALDKVSRKWLERWNNAHLGEIDRISARLGRPGAYYLSVNYEWGCTTGVLTAPKDGSARLVRVLDWRTPGLGRYVVAAHVAGRTGPFLTLTWPGYTGVLQAVAPGRFAAAINQAPMPRRGGGIYPFDWAANKLSVWRSGHATPAHALRDVFERAANFPEAREILIRTPLTAPAIFSLTGVSGEDLSIIERTENEAYVHDGRAAAANAWQAPGWEGRPRGKDSLGRVQQMMSANADFGRPSTWLQPPVLNDLTRLAMIADASNGRLVAEGFENREPATSLLEWDGGSSMEPKLPSKVGSGATSA